MVGTGGEGGDMQRLWLILVLLLAMFAISGCGGCERLLDGWNYESLSNETANVEVLSGGQVLRKYENVKIIYADADTQTLSIRTKEGKFFYLQGDLIVEVLTE